jgi:prepilin-type N-terminal cleavage/methylation domain-containing protein
MLLKQIDNKGFTLIEIAIVMVIIGILAGGGVSLMGVLSERKIRNESLDYLNEARASLVNFAKINGRLPFADSDGDGNQNPGQFIGTLPFLTLGISPTDAQRRILLYELNASLGANLATSCTALRAGLSVRPLMVDADGAPTAFPVAAVLISAGQKDADGDGNVFDDVPAGTHQGDNTDGTPNYIRNPPVTQFDDLVVYLEGLTLYGEICGKPNVSVSNGAIFGATVYVFNRTTGLDIGVVPTSTMTTYFGVIPGSQIELRTAASGGGVIIATSTPVTPVFPAGAGVTLVVP